MAEHVHSVFDTDRLFIIDPVTMEISTESEKLSVRQYDHNSERIAFKCPRTIEGHDMSLCNLITIHYENSDDEYENPKINVDYYTVDDMQLSEDGESILFSWLIQEGSTQIEGSLGFTVRFECLDEDGKCTYAKNTEWFDKLTVDKACFNIDRVVVAHSDFVARMETIAAEAKEVIETIPSEADMLALLVESGVMDLAADADGCLLVDADGSILVL